ncbi:MAG: S8 family serine peptidase [Hyphomicrobium sp.]|nr:S8 family serine peptidase [Hyphomicrobium sp.]
MSHPILAGAEIELETVRRADRRPSDPAHGTGVVSVLVGRPGSRVVGIAPRAKVIAVDAFHRAGRTDATDAFDLIAALDVLAARGARVINMSLSGPENVLLQRAVARFAERGTTIVAAAGTPSGTGSGYPARYEGVFAVAAIDQSMRPSRLSARGAHIVLSAPGVGIPVAAPGGTSRLASGTSFATPFVSAAVAVAKAQAGGDSAATAATLQALAKDLGAPGRDAVFGWGLVQFPPIGGC